MGVLQTAYRRFVPRRIKRMIQGQVRRELAAPRCSVSTRGGFATIPELFDIQSPGLDELERMAAQFPSMGGKEIGPFLRKAAREAPAGTAIVEVGSWLGAGTAQLVLGVRERGAEGSVPIHCFDRWEASKAEVMKAGDRGLAGLEPGQDTLPWVIEALRPFGVPISFVKGDIADVRWDGTPISVYVDDAAKSSKKFYRMLKTFGPSWIPGVTLLVLMDYHYWQKTGVADHRCQTNFIENYREHFEPVEGFRRGSNAAFTYVKRLEFEGLSLSALKWNGTARHKVVLASQT